MIALSKSAGWRPAVPSLVSPDSSLVGSGGTACTLREGTLSEAYLQRFNRPTMGGRFDPLKAILFRGRASARLISFRCEASRLPILCRVPVVYILPNLILGDAIALLNFAFECLTASVDCSQVVVGKFSPLLPDSSPWTSLRALSN